MKEKTVTPSATVISSPILDELGLAIVSGQMFAGQIVTLDNLQKRFSVSRTTARDVMRVLESMNLVVSRRRVGLVVQPPQNWNVFDARLIRWRLDGPQRTSQLRSLTELRVAIEPLAAAAAATFAKDEDKKLIVDLAAEMRKEGEAGNLDTFLQLDIKFHSLILRASQNEMFAALTEVIAEVLTGRTHYGLMPSSPTEVALHEHELIAEAVSNGNPEDAEIHMLATLSEVRQSLREREANLIPDAIPRHQA